MTHFTCDSCSTNDYAVAVGIGEQDLHNEWHPLVLAYMDANDENHNDALDALIEWVDANELADTEYDPRAGVAFEGWLA